MGVKPTTYRELECLDRLVSNRFFFFYRMPALVVTAFAFRFSTWRTFWLLSLSCYYSTVTTRFPANGFLGAHLIYQVQDLIVDLTVCYRKLQQLETPMTSVSWSFFPHAMNNNLPVIFTRFVCRKAKRATTFWGNYLSQTFFASTVYIFTYI